MFDEIRQQFPALHQSINRHPLVYLDSAATAMKPQCVIDAIAHFYSEEYGTVHRAVYSSAVRSTELYSEVREKVRSFLGAQKVEEIIFTKGTTEAINLVAYSFGERYISQGDEIIVTEMEHHANLIPWQQLCMRKGAKLRICPIDDRGNLLVEELEQMLSEKTVLIALSHMSNVTGAINPIAEVVAIAQKVGAKVLIDGAQGAAHLPVDVAELGVDFYAFSGHKAFGPTGVGILYGKYDLLKEMPPFLFGGDMIDEVSYEEASFALPPLRFEAGTPGIAQVIGFGAAINWIESIGREEIARYEEDLAKRAKTLLKEIDGLRFLGEPDHFGGIVSFVIEGVHSLDIGSLLDSRGIAARTGHLCAKPLMKRLGTKNAVRFSFAPYNTVEEVEKACAVLRELISLVQPAL